MKTGIRDLHIAVAASALALGACNHTMDPSKVQADIVASQAVAQKQIADAQANVDRVKADADKAVAEAREKASAAAKSDPTNSDDASVAKATKEATEQIADAVFALEQAKITGEHRVSLARCESQAGDALSACEQSAESNRNDSLIRAKAANDLSHKSA